VKALKTGIIAVISVLLVVIALSAQGDSLTIQNIHKQQVLIAGCENRIKDAKWKDYRIAFGVNDLMAQRLFDSGLFSLVEEKQEIRAHLDSLRQRIWSETVRDKDIQGLTGDSVSVVVGRLVYFGVPRSSASFGPLHASTSEVIVKFECELRDKGGVIILGKGQGSAAKSAVSGLFEFREKSVLFDQTVIGKALKSAVDMAVEDMIARCGKGKK
jgi:hypothetical protein